MLDFSALSSQSLHSPRINRIPITAHQGNSEHRLVSHETSSTVSELHQDTVKFAGTNKIDQHTATETAHKWIDRTKHRKTPFETGVWEVANNILSIATHNGPPYNPAQKYRFYNEKSGLIGSSTKALCVTSTNNKAVIEELARAPEGKSKSGDAAAVLKFAEQELKGAGFEQVYVSPKSEPVANFFKKHGYHDDGPGGPLVKDLSKRAKKSGHQQGESHAESSTAAGAPLQRTETQEGQWSTVSYFRRSGTRIPHPDGDTAVADRMISGVRQAHALDTQQNLGPSTRNWDIVP